MEITSFDDGDEIIQHQFEAINSEKGIYSATYYLYKIHSPIMFFHKDNYISFIEYIHINVPKTSVFYDTTYRKKVSFECLAKDGYKNITGIKDDPRKEESLVQSLISENTLCFKLEKDNSNIIRTPNDIKNQLTLILNEVILYDQNKYYFEKTIFDEEECFNTFIKMKILLGSFNSEDILVTYHYTLIMVTENEDVFLMFKLKFG